MRFQCKSKEKTYFQTNNWEWELRKISNENGVNSSKLWYVKNIILKSKPAIF
jgi:hypothetical protein